LWMSYYDKLPASVRRRLRQSEFNICPACMNIEARRIAKGNPSIEVYNRVIDAIERELKG